MKRAMSASLIAIALASGCATKKGAAGGVVVGASLVGLGALSASGQSGNPVAAGMLVYSGVGIAAIALVNLLVLLSDGDTPSADPPPAPARPPLPPPPPTRPQ